MGKIQKVSSSEFASKFGQWSFRAQSSPVEVTDRKTGMVKGYFVSPEEFAEFQQLRDRLPKAAFAWEMSEQMANDLQQPLAEDYPDLDHLTKV